jgi:hypothetical protein
MPSYSIQIPNNKLTAYRLVAAIILFLNVIMFFAISDGGIGWKRNFPYIMCALNMAAIVEVYLLKNRKKKYPFVLFANAFAWCLLGKYFGGILMLIFAIMALKTIKDLVIHFSDIGIVYPSFPEKIFPWKEVSFVKIKDDILTIDLKNNQLFQFTLMPEAVDGLDVEDFNRVMGEWVNARRLVEGSDS